MRILFLWEAWSQLALTANQRTGHTLFLHGVQIHFFERMQNQAAHGSAGQPGPMAQLFV